MNKPKHTPGPWTFDAMGVVCGRKIIGELAPVVVREFTNFADARLIASAPDAVLLFEDLQEYLSEHGGQRVELLSRIDAWLAKATGGAE